MDWLKCFPGYTILIEPLSPADNKVKHACCKASPRTYGKGHAQEQEGTAKMTGALLHISQQNQRV